MLMPEKPEIKQSVIIKPISVGIPEAEIETPKKEFNSDKNIKLQQKLGRRCVICDGFSVFF